MRTDTQTPERVLIVDDDVALCELLAERLRTEGFQIEAAHDGIQGLELARSQNYALLILDLMLPGLNGLEVLQRLRTTSLMPVLVLTARGDDVEKIVGLESGADDYLAKPFNPRELIARMRAILRRTNQLPRAGAPLVVGDITLDPQARDVSVNGTRVNLTSAEFTLLEALLNQPGRIVMRDALTETVLGRTLGPFDRVIDVHVSNLRRKLGPSPEGERIKAVRGSGYVFIVRSGVSVV